eukprot:969676-Prymnesium_polylepis.2
MHTHAPTNTHAHTRIHARAEWAVRAGGVVVVAAAVRAERRRASIGGFPTGGAMWGGRAARSAVWPRELSLIHI